jgi:NAD(P)-dependent dehydrogenase (short-subunit alcohol dehydrogenase family)
VDAHVRGDAPHEARDAAEETAAIIQNEGGQAFAVESDVTKADAVADLVGRTLGRYGRIDILDNNVGIGSTGGPVELGEDEWDQVFDVNVKSFFLTAKHVIPVMEKQGKGAIVNVSSIASIRSPKGVSYIAYNASKGAVNSLTLAIASQYADKGIRCNAILPGLMHTPMIDFLAEQYAKGEKDHNQAYDKMIAIRNRASPTGKMGTGWDTANAALFLASDEAAYVNGHLLVVDGGITVRA